MAKLCEICGGKHYAKSRCKIHYKMPSQLNPKSIKQSVKPISKFSEKKISQLAEYRKVRDKYLKENPICEFPECNSSKVELHHSKGKIGELLTDVRHFKSLCRTHHRFIEENPLEAKKLGLSKNRL